MAGSSPARQSTSAGGVHCQLIGVRVSDGVEVPLSAQRWDFVGKVAWLADGSGLMMAATAERLPSIQIWHITYPEGAARRVTNDASKYYSLSLAGQVLVAMQTVDLTSIWVATELRTGQASQLITSKDDVYLGLSWTPDERIIYGSRARGNEELWIMKPDGSDQQPLVLEGSNGSPNVSRDGRYLVFTSIRAGKRNVWRQNLTNGQLKRITEGDWEIRAQASPDGDWIVYDTFGSSTPALWKVPIDGGPAVRLIDKPAAAAEISPDGQLIACNYLDEAASRWRMAIFSFGSGELIKAFDNPTVSGRILRWTSDGQAVTYIGTRGGVSNIWSQPIEGGEPKQLTNFTTGAMSIFAWSHDGRKLAFQRSQEANDVILIKNFY